MEFDLNSWKEIADHLRHGIRWAQRREKDSGLPIHRVLGQPYAKAAELDDWMRNHVAITKSDISETSESFRKVFGSDRKIYLIYSELTLNPIVPEIIAAYDRVVAIKQQGEEIGDRELRAILQKKPLVTFDPKGEHGKDNFNFRAEHSACVCEVRAAAYVASTLSEYKSLEIPVVGTTYGEVYEKANITFVSFGTLINSKSQEILNHPRALVGFHGGRFVSNRLSLSQTPLENDQRKPLHRPVVDDGPDDYGMILRIEPNLGRKNKGRVWIACAGVQQAGTSAAAWILANDWQSIADKIVEQTGNFACLVAAKRKPGSILDYSAQLLWIVERLEDLKEYEI